MITNADYEIVKENLKLFIPSEGEDEIKKIILECMERHIPMKAVKGDENHMACPSCGHIFGNKLPGYCPDCGQKLKTLPPHIETLRQLKAECKARDENCTGCPFMNPPGLCTFVLAPENWNV